jgi:LysR family glycine cleavage system transcriptional activator
VKIFATTAKIISLPPVAQPDLAAGRLIVLSARSLPLGHPYCAFVPAEKRKRPNVQSLIELLATP